MALQVNDSTELGFWPEIASAGMQVGKTILGEQSRKDKVQAERDRQRTERRRLALEQQRLKQEGAFKREQVRQSSRQFNQRNTLLRGALIAGGLVTVLGLGYLILKK